MPKLERAGLDQGRYGHLVEAATIAGAKEHLEDFLETKGRFNAQNVHRGGWVAPNFFILDPPMRRFRQVAARAMTRQRIMEFQSLPCFDLWFEDRALPRAEAGRRTRLQPEEAGTAASQQPTEAKDGSHAQAGVREPGNGNQREATGPAANKGGRPTDKRTWRLYQRCYQLYVIEDKSAPTVKVIINRECGKEVIKEDSQVRLYASRYAKKKGKRRKHQDSPRK